jgi:hypothetical protein
MFYNIGPWSCSTVQLRHSASGESRADSRSEFVNVKTTFLLPPVACTIKGLGL